MSLFSKKEKVEEPEFLSSKINSQVINYNVYKLNNKQKVICFISLMLAGGIIGLIFYGGLFKSEGENTLFTYISNAAVFLLGGLIANKVIKPIIVNMFKQKRLQKFKLQFRDFLSTLSTSLSSGMNMNDALIGSYDDVCSQYGESSTIAIEVKELINCTINNISIEDAMDSLGQRSGIDDISNFSAVFSVSYRSGGNLKFIVKRTADIICEKMLISEEIESKLTSNKIQLYMMLIIPVILVLLMRIMSSEFAESFSSITGVIANTIAIVMFFIAYRVGSKIMNIKG